MKVEDKRRDIIYKLFCNLKTGDIFEYQDNIYMFIWVNKFAPPAIIDLNTNIAYGYGCPVSLAERFNMNTFDCLEDIIVEVLNAKIVIEDREN